jgi:CMP-N,N'-diacetyllegionaminic acid synthase
LTTLALIPARGGSQELPRKNLAPLGGKPLVVWTIEAALACGRLDRVVVTTDDDEIAGVARAAGADVPFLRPTELAGGDVADQPVFAHALAELDDEVDVVVWLRPTAPLRTAEDITGALAVFERVHPDAVRSVCRVSEHPYWMKRVDGDLLEPFLDGKDETSHPQRQTLPTLYRLNGAVDVIDVRAAERNGALFAGRLAAYLMPEERSIDIDTELDLRIAEALLEARA